MANGINVLIVDDISTTLDNLRKLLAFEPDIEVVGTAGTGREAIEQTKKLHPDVVLMDVNMPEMDGIQATEILASEAPDSPVIIMSVQGERDYLRRAATAPMAPPEPPPAAPVPAEEAGEPAAVDSLGEVPVAERPEAETVKAELAELALAQTDEAEAGAVEAGEAEADAAEVPEAETDEAGTEAEPAPPIDSAALEREPGTPVDEAAAGGAVPAPADEPAEESAPELLPATEQAVEAPAAEPATVDVEGGAAAAVLETEPEAPAPPVAPVPQTYGELVVFYGGKGGVGTSVLAANLACALSREAGARVALVDLDLQFGDVGVLLNLPQTQSISDLVASIDQLDPDFANDVMADGPAGIRVLPAATSPELADLVAPEHVQTILELLRKMFDFVVVDTSSNLGDVTLTALDMASSVILVTAPSITSVKNAKLALRLLESISIPTGAVTLVLNRCEAHTEFNKDSIESHLKFPITIQIPHDPRTVVNSINRGVPFVINNPEVEASQRVRQLAAHLLPESIRTAPPPPRNRGMLFGRR